MEQNILEVSYKIRTTMLKKLHAFTGMLFTATGYRWKVHRFGDHKIGTWTRTNKGLKKSKKDKKVFVLIPGFGDTPISWFLLLKLMLPILYLRYDEVVILDFPGFCGFLQDEKSFHTMDLYLKQTCALLEKLKPHTIVGHSLGGWLTSHYSATSKKPPQRIVLIAPSGAFESIQTKQEWAETFYYIVRSQDFNFLRKLLFAKEPPLFRFVSSEFTKFLSKKENQEFIFSIKDRHLVEKLLPKIKSDVWIVWGDQDRLVPFKTMKGWTKLLPKYVGEKQTIVLKGLGHSPQLEGLRKTAHALSKIIRHPYITTDIP